MWTLIIIALVATYVWFWYTDRRNTVTATKTVTSTIGLGIKEVFSAVKVEADIAKIDNERLNYETDRLARFAERNAERIVKETLEDLGLGNDFKVNQANRLAEAKARLEDAKAKAVK